MLAVVIMLLLNREDDLYTFFLSFYLSFVENCSFYFFFHLLFTLGLVTDCSGNVSNIRAANGGGTQSGLIPSGSVYLCEPESVVIRNYFA